MIKHLQFYEKDVCMNRISIILCILFFPLQSADLKKELVTVEFDDKTTLQLEKNVLTASNVFKNKFDRWGGQTLQIHDLSPKLFGKVLYPLMRSVSTEDKKLQNEQDADKGIRARIKFLSFDQIKELAMAADYYDIPQLLPVFVNRCAELLTKPSSLKDFAIDPELMLVRLDMPTDLTNQIENSPIIESKARQFFLRSPLYELPGEHLPVFSSTGKFLATASTDQVYVRNPQTGKLLYSSPKYDNRVWDLSFAFDSLFITDPYGLVRIWTPPTGRAFPAAVNVGSMAKVQNIAFAPDGTSMAVDKEKGKIEVFGTHGKSIPYVIPNLSEYGAYTITFSLDGKNLLVFGDGKARFLSLKTGHWDDSLNFSRDLQRIQVSPDQKRFAGSFFKHDNVRGADLYSMEGQISHLDSKFGGGRDPFLLFSPNGKIVVAAFDFETVKLYDPLTGDKLREISSDQKKHFDVSEIANSPNGELIAIGYNKDPYRNSADTRDATWKIDLWNVQDRRNIRLIDTITDLEQSRDKMAVYKLTFSPDSRLLAAEIDSDRAFARGERYQDPKSVKVWFLGGKIPLELSLALLALDATVPRPANLKPLRDFVNHEVKQLPNQSMREILQAFFDKKFASV